MLDLSVKIKYKKKMGVLNVNISKEYTKWILTKPFECYCLSKETLTIAVSC